MSSNVRAGGAFHEGKPHLNVGGSWHEGKEIHVHAGGSWRRVWQNLIPVTINRSSNTRSTFDLHSWLNTHFSGQIPSSIQVTLTGVFVGRVGSLYNNTSINGTSGILISSALSGKTIILINNATISGGGGGGGDSAHSSGGNGGYGIEAQIPISITNNGVIQGGGGGGSLDTGGGRMAPGGGGAGYGAGGRIYALVASSGTLTSGGAGKSVSYAIGGHGGSPGANGERKAASPGTGGAAVSGNSHVTWKKQGTIHGALK